MSLIRINFLLDTTNMADIYYICIMVIIIIIIIHKIDSALSGSFEANIYKHRGRGEHALFFLGAI